MSSPRMPKSWALNDALPHAFIVNGRRRWCHAGLLRLIPVLPRWTHRRERHAREEVIGRRQQAAAAATTPGVVDNYQIVACLQLTFQCPERGAERGHAVRRERRRRTIVERDEPRVRIRHPLRQIAGLRAAEPTCRYLLPGGGVNLGYRRDDVHRRARGAVRIDDRRQNRVLVSRAAPAARHAAVLPEDLPRR